MKRGTVEGRQRQADAARRTHTIHGMKGTPEYHSWRSMKQRCLDQNDPFFHRYGGRGITVCPTWTTSFEAFYKDMGPRPHGTCLDRINLNGSYEPENCRWVSQRTQQRNRSSNRKITFDGHTMLLVEWAEHLGLNYKTLLTRLNKLHWPVERALTQEKMR